MAYKVLGQSNPSANTDVDVYTVPISKETVISTITICNQGVDTQFRIAVRVGGASLSKEKYIVYDADIKSKETIGLTFGITLSTTDVVTVRATSSDVSFNLFGNES
jgi:hypothetical protein